MISKKNANKGMRPDLFMIVMINKLTNYKFDLKAKTDDEEAVLQGRVFHCAMVLGKNEFWNCTCEVLATMFWSCRA